MLVTRNRRPLGVVPIDPRPEPEQHEKARQQDDDLRRSLDAVEQALREAAMGMAAIRRRLRFPLDSVRLDGNDDES